MYKKDKRKPIRLCLLLMGLTACFMSCGKEKTREEDKMIDGYESLATLGDSSHIEDDASDDATVIIEKQETKTETTETKTDAITVDDKGNFVIDDKNEDVIIEKTDDGTEIATIKTEEGEVKVAVKKDESGKTVVDNSKTVTTDAETSETKIVDTTAPSKNETAPTAGVKTEIKVDDKGNVVVKKTETTTITVTVTATPTATPKETQKPETTQIAAKATDTPVPVISKKPENTNAPTVKPTEKVTTPTPKATDTPKPQATNTPTVKLTSTPTAKPAEKVDTPIPQATNTPVPTATNTPTPKATNTPTPTVHIHNWAAVTETVHHAEEGHWETVETEWTENVYYTGYCQNTFPDAKSIYELMKEEGTWDPDMFDGISITQKAKDGGHYDTYIIMPRFGVWPQYAKNLLNTYGSSTALKNLKVDEIVHKENKDIYVVDKEAWDETVITGYKCSCGATKN